MFVGLVFVFGEVIYRAKIYFLVSPAALLEISHMARLNSRIYLEWLKTGDSDPFRPPFTVFANKDIDNEDRLQEIVRKTALPPSREWVSSDFLQDEKWAERTRYSVHSNSLGFRGRSHAARKKKGIYRIIALGTYQTFGHGVRDDETYPSQLEADLNRRSQSNSYEVWNGGRHASTAIVGLARLKYEIFKYDPDLLIIDYGHVDPYTVDDNLFLNALRFPDDAAFQTAKGILRPVIALTGNSVLTARLLKNAIYLSRDEGTREFLATMRHILDLTAKRHVPVILVKQLPVPVATEAFRKLAGADNYFVDVHEVFSRNPPNLLLAKKFVTEPNWLWDIEEGYAPVGRRFRFFSYRLNYLQLNSTGHKVLARALASEIFKIRNDRETKTP